MMRVFNRLGLVLIGLCTFSLVVTFLILSSRVGTTLQSLGLPGYVWDWGDSNKTDLAIVVFGDSWVDDGVPLKKEHGTFSLGGESNRHQLQGPSWTEVLCRELECTSYLNFASSGPITVQSPPSGALTSKSLYRNISSLPDVVKTTQTTPELPDFPAQIAAYLSLAPSLPAVKTLFVLSFGLWDTYYYASLALDKEKAEGAAVSSIDTIFSQLDKLFTAFAAKTEDALSDEELEAEKNNVHDFQVVIPQLIDPTFLPGWRSSRPLPLPPTSVAEEQKAAVRLVSRWNSHLEGRISSWIQETPATVRSIISGATQSKAESTEDKKEHKEDGKDNNGDDDEDNEDGVAEWPEDEEDELAPSSLLWEKTIHFPDLKTYFLDSLRTKYLEVHKVFDSNGLGTENSPYESVSVPCAPVAGFEELKRDGKTAKGQGIDATSRSGLDGTQQSNGNCGDAEKWLFWDEWNLGPRAQREVGQNVALAVREENKKKSEKGADSEESKR